MKTGMVCEFCGGNTVKKTVKKQHWLKGKLHRRERGGGGLRSVWREVFPREDSPSRFGMAKSFSVQGQAAGFDMTDQDQIHMFAAAYNSSVAADRGDPEAVLPARPESPGEDSRVKRNRARSLRRRIASISKKHPGKRRR